MTDLSCERNAVVEYAKKMLETVPELKESIDAGAEFGITKVQELSSCTSASCTVSVVIKNTFVSRGYDARTVRVSLDATMTLNGIPAGGCQYRSNVPVDGTAPLGCTNAWGATYSAVAARLRGRKFIPYAVRYIVGAEVYATLDVERLMSEFESKVEQASALPSCSSESPKPTKSPTPKQTRSHRPIKSPRPKKFPKPTKSSSSKKPTKPPKDPCERYGSNYCKRYLSQGSTQPLPLLPYKDGKGHHVPAKNIFSKINNKAVYDFYNTALAIPNCFLNKCGIQHGKVSTVKKGGLPPKSSITLLQLNFGYYKLDRSQLMTWEDVATIETCALVRGGAVPLEVAEATVAKTIKLYRDTKNIPESKLAIPVSGGEAIPNSGTRPSENATSISLMQCIKG